MKKFKIGIIGVFSFAIISILSINFNVFAAGCTYKTLESFKDFYEKKCTKKNISNYYRVNMSWDDNNEYTISIKGKDVDKDDEFQVVEISEGKLADGVKISDLNKITKENPLTLKVNPNKKDDDNIVKIKIKLVKSKEFKDCLHNSACDKKYKYTDGSPYTIDLVAYDGEDIPKSSALNGTNILTNKLQEYTTKRQTLINNSKYSEFINNILGSKKLNVIEVDTIKVNANKEKVKDDQKLYCNPNIDGDTVFNINEKVGNTKEDYYKSNTKYYHVQGKSKDVESVVLNYNYSPTVSGKDTVDICDTQCEELVKVEYGPPVASMAGLCFEYSVRVTSYVKCNANINYSLADLEKELETKYNYCTPKPVCNNTEDYYDQAGPNDQFDLCIEECDGGKYSRSCSNKCYKKVYGKSGNVDMNLDFMNDIKVSKIVKTQDRDYEDCEDSDGCYYFEKGKKTIKWKGKSKNYNPLNCSKVSAVNSQSTPGRYYLEKKKNTGNGCPQDVLGTDYYFVKVDGIYYDKYYGGYTCSDVCYWTGCSRSSYLNPAQARKDAEDNADKIIKALNSCTSKAKCSTTTNKVTINANYATYDKLQNTDNNVSSSDTNYSECNTGNNYTASFGEAKVPSNNAKGDNALFNNKDNIVIDRDACYVSGSDDTEKYLTEWTFPGTYLNVKHGNTSFSKPSDTTGYVYKEKNFCLPLNVASVNTKWWNEFVNNGKVISYNPNGQNSGILYNILATARNFGYFDWNFDVNCFFGLNNDVSGGSSSTSGNEGEDVSNNKCNKAPLNDNYSFRVVDKSSETALFANRSNIGYNWTSSATASKLEDGYNEDPKEIIQKIANKNDNNLDYEFNLTKENLQKIRNYTKNSKKNTYSNFDNGSIQTSKEKTILYYESPLILEINGKRNATLGVNNNYK